MLGESEIAKYWANRAARQGERTVGFQNSPLEVQDQRYALRAEFIVPHLDRSLATLEYGCGIGRYASYFEEYVGVDVTERLLEIARDRHPHTRFELLRQPWLDATFDWDFQQVFTATVLQHNDDSMVNRILGSIAARKSAGFRFALYENFHRNARHVAARSPERYLELVCEHYSNADLKATDSHVIHGERHCLTIIDV